MSNEHKIKASILNESSSIRAGVQEASNNSISGNLTNTPTATTQTKGIIRIATDEEALAGELNNVAITPHTLELRTKTFIYEQSTASDTWVIEHNLNRKPSITIVDSAETIIIPDECIYDNENTVTITFLASFAGKAYLN